MNELSQLKERVAHLSDQVKTYEESMTELRQRSDIQDSLNEILNISLMHISLHEQMNKILMLVLTIPWLALDKKGGVFLTDDTGSGLEMVTHHNLGESLLKLCSHIQFGQCLCGRAAVSQDLIFKTCLDHEHDIMPEGITEHGHYNMPILSKGNTLGVLNLYVKHGHVQSKVEIDFLHATAKAMAGIIERKKIEEKLHRLSYLDDLTGIPNRRQFMKNLDEVIVDSGDKKNMFAVLFVDLDRFKSINDTFGHEFGDEILVQATLRMQESLRETDVIARLGGDEFVVILELISSPVMAMQIATKLIEALSDDYRIKSKSLSIGASIGVSIFPVHAEQSEALLKKADMALYEAKEDRGKAILYVESE